MGIVDDRTAASSLRRWGRLPVFSSCSITPTTIVSSMPWVSTFVWPDTPPGEGGGVKAILPALLGRSSMRMEMDREGEGGVVVECDLLTLFCGGCWGCMGSVVVVVVAVEGGERAGLGPPGTEMPNEGRDSDLRRVL